MTRRFNINIENYSKCSTHKLIGGSVYENDIVKLIPHKKNARITKINSIKNNWKHLSNISKLTILSHCLDNYGNHYFTGYFSEGLSIKTKKGVFNCPISEKGHTDVFIMKMRDNEIIYIIPVMGIKSDSGLDIKVDNYGDVYVCGYYTDSITFDTIYLSNYDENKHMFVAKMNSKSFEWIWAIDVLGGNSSSSILRIDENYNNIYVSGSYDDTIEFRTMPVKKYTSNKSNNSFYAKINMFNGDYKYIEGCENMTITDIVLKDASTYILGNIFGKTEFMEKNIEGNGMVIIKITNNTLINLKIFNDTIGKTLEIADSIYVITNKSLMKLDYNYNVIWENIMEINSISKDYDNTLYLLGRMNDEIIINDKIYRKNGVHTFLLKISKNNFVIDFSIYHNNNENNNQNNNENKNKIFTKLHIHHNEIYVSGTIDGTYHIVKYIPDDRDKKCLGIVRTQNYSDSGSMVDVDFSGYLSTGYKDLKAGYDYYIQEDGGIDINVNDYYFGTALSVDKLLIKR